MKIEGHIVTCPIQGIVFLLHSNKINPKIISVMITRLTSV
jgi:hypothetical protein